MGAWVTGIYQALQLLATLLMGGASSSVESIGIDSINQFSQKTWIFKAMSLLMLILALKYSIQMDPNIWL